MYRPNPASKKDLQRTPDKAQWARPRERGSVFPLAGLVLAAGALALVLLTGLSQHALDRARAQNAADAAVLAGLAEGESGARDLALRNGAELQTYWQQGRQAHVLVLYGEAWAEATAMIDIVDIDPVNE